MGEVPGAVGGKLRSRIRVQSKLGKPGIRMNSQSERAPVAILPDGAVERRIGVHERVVVAEGEERGNRDPARACRAVDDDGGVLALDEAERLLDPRAARNFENPGGKRLGAELDQVPVPGGVDRPRVGVGGERGAGFHDLLQPGEQDVPLDRRTQGGDEEAVVAAGIRARHRSHGESASPVGQEPLEPGRALVIRADLARHLHGHSPLCWRSLATRPVHPVWWLAPTPDPSSPWKYS